MARNERDLRARSWFVVKTASSEWQANALVRGAALFVLIVSALVCSIMLFHGLFLGFANMLTPDNGPAALAEVWLGIVFAVTGAFAGLVNWRMYRLAYETSEEPVVVGAERQEVLGAHKWCTVYAKCDGAKTPRRPLKAKERLLEEASRYADEFLLNALVNPRCVFWRISEHVRPGRRMLDCAVETEVAPPAARGLRICGNNDIAVGNADAAPCFLAVPVSFQKRGDLTIKQSVKNSSGTLLPIVKHYELAERIVTMIESYEFGGKRGEDVFEQGEWGSIKEDLEAYLMNMEPNETIEVPIRTVDFMLEYADENSAEERAFCRCILEVLVGLKDVIPVCVSLHVAAVADTGRTSPDFPVRVFNLHMEEKREMDNKPFSVLPNRRKSPIIASIDRLCDKIFHRTDTVYYNLARAGRSTSYHLYVEGPEGTYYARGSLLRDNPEDWREINAEYVELQKRYGQRHAHIYIRNGHRMSNASFMFRYKKAPLDTYHIMFMAAFLCLAVLIVCALASITGLANLKYPSAEGGQELGRTLANLSVPAMLLAIASAAGPWIYNRASDGRDESLGIQVSTVVLTFCSAAGMVLFFYCAMKQPALAMKVGIWLWSILAAVMTINAGMVGYVALLHSSLYRYLTSKPVEGGASQHVFVHHEPSGPFRVEDGMRLDTPQGRVAKNAYSYWTNAVVDFKKLCRIGDEEDR